MRKQSIKMPPNMSPWHSKWHILHLSIRVKINMITYLNLTFIDKWKMCHFECHGLIYFSKVSNWLMKMYLFYNWIYFSKKISNMPQRKFCIIENWEYASDLYEVVSHSTSNSGINGSIPLDVQCISRIQDFQTCSFTFSNSQFSIMQNFLCGIFEIFFEKINSIIK
jgi:hypothetical protein